MLAPKAMSSTPPISIVVINHNGAAQLPACLASVTDQRRIAPELIVVDRGSSDGSPDWLRRHERIATLMLETEIGHFVAANRGLAAARGEWITFLQPADRLVGDNILSECHHWMTKTEAGVVAGEVSCNDGRILKLRSRPNARSSDFVPETGTFYRRTLFEENGVFDVTLPLMAAYEFNVRLWKNRIRFKPLPLRVVASDRRSTFSRAACREEIRVRHRYFSPAKNFLSDARSVLHWLLRR